MKLYIERNGSGWGGDYACYLVDLETKKFSQLTNHNLMGTHNFEQKEKLDKIFEMSKCACYRELKDNYAGIEAVAEVDVQKTGYVVMDAQADSVYLINGDSVKLIWSPMEYPYVHTSSEKVNKLLSALVSEVSGDGKRFGAALQIENPVIGEVKDPDTWIQMMTVSSKDFIVPRTESIGSLVESLTKSLTSSGEFKIGQQEVDSKTYEDFKRRQKEVAKKLETSKCRPLDISYILQQTERFAHDLLSDAKYKLEEEEILEVARRMAAAAVSYLGCECGRLDVTRDLFRSAREKK